MLTDVDTRSNEGSVMSGSHFFCKSYPGPNAMPANKIASGSIEEFIKYNTTYSNVHPIPLQHIFLGGSSELEPELPEWLCRTLTVSSESTLESVLDSDVYRTWCAGGGKKCLM